MPCFAFHDAISDAQILDSLDVRYSKKQTRPPAKLDGFDSELLQASERSHAMTMPAPSKLIGIEKRRLFLLRNECLCLHD